MSTKNKNLAGTIAPQPEPQDNDKLLSNLIGKLQKKFGPSSIRFFDHQAQNWTWNTISTGSLMLDHVTGIGGYPTGRIVEIYGPEASGKTTLGLHAIASCQAQRKNKNCVFIDVEHALDPKYAEAVGVDTKRLIVAQPDHAEEALNILEQLACSGMIDLIVLDSVAALVPQGEYDHAMQDQTIGLQARLMSKALRKLKSIFYKNNLTVIFINQIRSKIGIMFGPQETTPGGRALKFYATMRIEVRKIETIMQNGQAIANRVRCKISKNKLAAPFQTTQIEIKYGSGINTEKEVIQLGIKHGFLNVKGTWYYQDDQKLGQGTINVCKWYHNHPHDYQALIAKIKAVIKK